MRAFFTVLLASCFWVPATAQTTGCTDPAATNFSPSATVNDGSCAYAVTYYNPLLRAPFAAGIAESSGMVLSGGKLWTHNDSGNPAQIFSVDTNTGAILQTVYVDNFPNTDWEDIAADSAFIYIGNFGNNNGTRRDLSILKIAKANIGTAAVVHLNAQEIAFSYTDQTSYTSTTTTNFDCEALLVRGDSLYLFTKNYGDNQTRVYKLPKTPGTYAVTPYTHFNTNGLITGADYNPVTREVVLVGYTFVVVGLGVQSKSFLYFLNDFKADSFFSGNKRRIEIANTNGWQIEGVCYAPGGQFIISCETTPAVSASFYYGNKARVVAVKNLPAGPLSAGTLYPNPAEDRITLQGLPNAQSYSVFNTAGVLVMRGSFAGSGPQQIGVKDLPAGNYQVQVVLPGGQPPAFFSFLKQ